MTYLDCFKTIESIFFLEKKKTDLKIGSINARGLVDMINRRELFNWFGKNNWVYILYKKRIALKGSCMTGAMNGAIKLFWVS